VLLTKETHTNSLKGPSEIISKEDIEMQINYMSLSLKELNPIQ
jgi:hypothetical protein